MRAKLIIGLFYFLIIATTVFMCAKSIEKSLPAPQQNCKRVSIYKRCLESTVSIAAGNRAGTGVVVGRGIILTNRHILDQDENGTLADDEANVEITLNSLGETSTVETGTLIFQPRVNWLMDNLSDYCLISIQSTPTVAPIVSSMPLFGDDVFTIGLTAGCPLNIYAGKQSSPINGFERASMSAYFGNSGGGVWDDNHRLAGIVTRIKYASMMPGWPKGLTPLVPQWCEYISIETVREGLRDSGMEKLLGE